MSAHLSFGPCAGREASSIFVVFESATVNISRSWLGCGFMGLWEGQLGLQVEEDRLVFERMRGGGVSGGGIVATATGGHHSAVVT